MMVTAGGSATVSQTSTEYQGLISCLPHYRRAAFDPRSGRSFPSISSAPAVVLRSDIVGFTLLTDRIVKRGIVGAEQLADVMNRVINRMAEIAWGHGGELVTWEGDAGTFVWFAREGVSLDDATVLAVQVASTEPPFGFAALSAADRFLTLRSVEETTNGILLWPARRC
jgi:class 3 adenylate cyclase